jgi:hypothetical protein
MVLIIRYSNAIYLENDMDNFNLQTAIRIITDSSGGFSYDTLARAIFSVGSSSGYLEILSDCKNLCERLEAQGVLKKCSCCNPSIDYYYEYIRH